MLSLRLITGPLLIVAWLALMFFDDRLDAAHWPAWFESLWSLRGGRPRGVLLTVLLLLVVAPLAARELSTIVQGNGIASRRWLTVLAAVAGVLTLALWPEPNRAAVVATAAVALCALSMIVFTRGHAVDGVLAAMGATLFAFVYLGLMPGFLLLLRQNSSAWLVVGVVLATKSCDIGAYFTGRAIGRHKLIPWLSPGKTWEGLVGGIVAGAAAGAGLAALSTYLPLDDHVTPPFGAVCGAIFAVVGQFGDLAESLLKRGARLKDSGTLLPGMGGVLDVLDSPLMVAPVAWWLLG